MDNDVAKKQIKSTSMFSHHSIGYMSVTSKSHQEMQNCYSIINNFFVKTLKEMKEDFPDKVITINRLYNQEYFPNDEGVLPPDNFDEDAILTILIQEQRDGEDSIDIMSSSIFIYDVDYGDESIGKYLH